jgi:hypothetical protein
LQLVPNVLLPPISKGRVEGNVKLDPLIGYWGLIFLCVLCPEINASEKKVDNTRSYSVSTIFKHIKAMVSRLEIVKLESEVKMKHKQKGVGSNSVLAYQSPPSCFLVRSKQKRKTVFCIATLLNNIDMTTTRSRGLGSKVIQWTRYIHALIDVYLKMGRFLSPKWSPDTWLFASIDSFDVILAPLMIIRV